VGVMCPLCKSQRWFQVSGIEVREICTDGPVRQGSSVVQFHLGGSMVFHGISPARIVGITDLVLVAVQGAPMRDVCAMSDHCQSQRSEMIEVKTGAKSHDRDNEIETR
jgi:hypothetical protein